VQRIEQSPAPDIAESAYLLQRAFDSNQTTYSAASYDTLYKSSKWEKLIELSQKTNAKQINLNHYEEHEFLLNRNKYANQHFK
jgi:hypothetical protein